MRILVIVPPQRRDFYSYLEEDKENEYVLLWHESEKKYKESGTVAPSFFKSIYFWDQFFTPQKLIKKINPNKIIFFEIIDQQQIALIVSARKNKITTFYLEHGAAGSKETAIERAEIPEFVTSHKLPYIINRLKNSFSQVLKTKLFYYSNLSGFMNIKHLISYWKLPFMMLKFSPNKALNKILFRERVPRYSIVFNKANLEEYQLYTGINDEEAIISGLPFFDKYFRAKGTNKEHIVYIEHPYFEEGLLNWTIDHHQSIANRLFDFANNSKRNVYVKLHPRSDLKLWQPFIKRNSYLQVIQQGDFTDLYLSSSLIIGFSSSLLTGLICAKKNIVNIGWHPIPQIFGVDFSSTGLCHQSLNVNDLNEKFNYWEKNNLSIEKDEEYQNFLREYNYPFDGKATQRVLEAIHSL